MTAEAQLERPERQNGETYAESPVAANPETPQELSAADLAQIEADKKLLEESAEGPVCVEDLVEEDIEEAPQEGLEVLESVQIEEAPGIPLVVFGGKPVHISLGQKLNMVMAGLTAAEGQKLKASMTQGYASSSSFSGTTHTKGFAADFVTGTWSDSGATPISVEHIHTALLHESNSDLISNVTKPGAHRHVEKEIAKRPRHPV